MRGKPNRHATMLSLWTPEQLVPADHPMRAINRAGSLPNGWIFRPWLTGPHWLQEMRAHYTLKVLYLEIGASDEISPAASLRMGYRIVVVHCPLHQVMLPLHHDTLVKTGTQTMALSDGGRGAPHT